MSAEATPQQCQAQVGQPPHWIHYHRCTRTARQQVGGLGLCAQHARMVEGLSAEATERHFAFYSWGRYPRRSGGGSYGDCR